MLRFPSGLCLRSLKHPKIVLNLRLANQLINRVLSAIDKKSRRYQMSPGAKESLCYIVFSAFSLKDLHQ